MSDVVVITGASAGIAVLLFQVAVALASICIVSKKKALWFTALAIAAIGGAQMLYALYMVAPAH